MRIRWRLGGWPQRNARCGPGLACVVCCRRRRVGDVVGVGVGAVDQGTRSDEACRRCWRCAPRWSAHPTTCSRSTPPPGRTACSTGRGGHGKDTRPLSAGAGRCRRCRTVRAARRGQASTRLRDLRGAGGVQGPFMCCRCTRKVREATRETAVPGGAVRRGSYCPTAECKCALPLAPVLTHVQGLIRPMQDVPTQGCRRCDEVAVLRGAVGLIIR